MSKETKKHSTEAKAQQTTKPKALPAKSVTKEPQHEEHMHLKHIMHSPALVDVYLAVSDDRGDLMSDNKLEENVISFINEFKDKELHEIDKPAVVISLLQSLHKNYCASLERAENITDGIQTKSGIRRGMLLNIEKKLLRKKGKQWVVHYTETYDKKSLRSAQDYMALARIPNIIRYSVFRKERLMDALRAIKFLGIKMDDPRDDPMAALFEQFDIAFNPKNSRSKETMRDLKLEIDCAIAVTKIKKAEQEKETEPDIDPDYVKKLIDAGVAEIANFDVFRISYTSLIFY
jgi:hypothetical protein